MIRCLESPTVYAVILDYDKCSMFNTAKWGRSKKCRLTQFINNISNFLAVTVTDKQN